jgi:hypothetical protein
MLPRVDEEVIDQRTTGPRRENNCWLPFEWFGRTVFEYRLREAKRDALHADADLCHGYDA